MRENRERWRRRGDLKGRISPARIHPGQERGRNSSPDPPGTGEGEEFQPGSTRDRREGGIPAGIHPGQERGRNSSRDPPGTGEGGGIPARIHPGRERGRNSSQDPPGTGEGEEFQSGSTRDRREGGIPARIHPGQERERNSSPDPPGTGEGEEFQPGSTRDGREGEEFQPGSTRDRRGGGIPARIHPGRERGRNSSQDPPGTGEGEEFQPGSTREKGEGEEFQPGSTRDRREGGIPARIHPGQERGRNSSRDPPGTGEGEEFQPGSTRDRRGGGIPAGIHPGQGRGRNSSPDPPGTGEGEEFQPGSTRDGRGGGIPARIHPGQEREEFQPGSTRDRRGGGIPARIHPGQERGRNSSPDPPGTGEERSRGNSSPDPPGRAALERGKLEDLLQDLKNELEKRQQKKNPEVSRADTAAQGQGEKNQQPDVKSSISRCGKVTFQLPLDAAAGLEERVCHFSWRSSALKETLRKLRAAVTLDPATAHPELELSPDGKRVRRGPARALPDSPERFDYWPFVLGQQRFSAGRHCWDVDVGEGGDWAVGVARESVRRKGRLSLGPQGGIWGLERWGGQLRALTARKATPLAPPRPPRAPRWPPRRVSVHLDCAGGSVAFLDAEGGGVLFVFSRVAFGGEGLRPWLWVVGAGSQLRLCP